MAKAYIKIDEDGTIYARPGFTKDEQHKALDDTITLLKVEDCGTVLFYGSDGEWRELAVLNDGGRELQPDLNFSETQM